MIPAFACFTILSADDQVIYNAADAPVDMSRPIHETLPHLFPGAHLIFDVGSSCGPGPADYLLQPLSVGSTQGAVLVRAVSPAGRASAQGLAPVAADGSVHVGALPRDEPHLKDN